MGSCSLFTNLYRCYSFIFCTLLYFYKLIGFTSVFPSLYLFSTWWWWKQGRKRRGYDPSFVFRTRTGSSYHVSYSHTSVLDTDSKLVLSSVVRVSWPSPFSVFEDPTISSSWTEGGVPVESFTYWTEGRYRNRTSLEHGIL